MHQACLLDGTRFPVSRRRGGDRGAGSSVKTQRRADSRRSRPPREQVEEARPAILETFIGKYSALLRFVHRRVSDRSEAEDVVQDVFLRVAGIDGLHVTTPFAYLLKVAENVARDRARGRHRATARNQQWHAFAFGAPDLTRDTADIRSLEGELIERDRGRRLDEQVRGLPSGARRAFELVAFGGLTHGEVASALGISKSGVEKHLALAKRRLSAALTGA